MPVSYVSETKQAHKGVFISDIYTKRVVDMKGVQTTGDLKISLRLSDFIPPFTGSHGMSWQKK